MQMNPPDIFSPEFIQDPYPFYKRMRDEHPLFYHAASQSYILSRHQDVDRALKNPVFSTRNCIWQVEPFHGRTIISMDGHEHASHRNIVNPAFRGRTLREQIGPLIAEKAGTLISAFRAQGEVELIAAFTGQLPLQVIVGMLGFPPSEYERFSGWYKALAASFANLTGDPAVQAAGLRVRQETAAYLLPIIAERRARPGADLISTLCHTEVDGGSRMSDEEIRAFCSVMLAAGSETTDKALSSLFKNLLEHPEQCERVTRDRSLIDAALAETLRFSPPVHMLLRETTAEVQTSGGTIPAGATVTCLLASANRDERRFARPDAFDIFRADNDLQRAFTGAAAHVAFGTGRHFCLGAMLAQTEVQIAANLLLDAMPDVRFADGPPPEVGFFLRGPATLQLRFAPTTMGV
jgi:cytochrome P450